MGDTARFGGEVGRDPIDKLRVMPISNIMST
jgi:hypothetical protein